MLSVLTLNLWNLNEPLSARLSGLVRFLSKAQPDVVALQEVSPSNGVPECSEIAERADYPFMQYVACGYWKGREEGLAVLSRTQFSPTFSVRLPDADADMPRFLQVVALRAGPFEGIRLANTHLAYHLNAGEVRLQQVNRIVEVLSGLEQCLVQPLVLCGDFNDTPNSAPIRQLTSGPVPLFDAWATIGASGGYTFSIDNPWAAADLWPGRRIDYIFVSKHLQVKSCRVVMTTDDGWGPVSDHYGLLAEIVPAYLL